MDNLRERFTPFLQDVFNVMKEGVLIIDTKGDIFFANTAYLNFIQLPAEEVLGKHLRDLRPHARLPEVVASGKTVLHAQRLEGLEEAYFVNMYPLRKGDEIIGGLSIITFLDDAARTRQELDAYEKRSKQLLKKVNNQSVGYTFDHIIAVAPEAVAMKAYAEKLAAGDMTVLLQSESGTGKELYAQAIHNASMRSGEVFLAVNCANFNADMLDSELFGYVEGSFTGAKKGGKIGLFEAAQGGTLFLDEISEMDIGLQAKLLRALQEKKIRPIGGTREIPVDVRIVCASNADLARRVDEGKFRKDLYYRLNVFMITIPPLRTRPDDIPAIVESMLQALRHKHHRRLEITPDAIAVLQSYQWPGNVRELKNVVEYSAYMCENDVITTASLPDGLSRAIADDESKPLSERVHEFERTEITNMLQRYGSTLDGKKQAAAALGISLASLYNKIK